MTGKFTTLDLTKSFINGHPRTSQICMKIPQSHVETGEVQQTQTTDDTFKIDGDQSQEIKEDHFGGVE
jgi:hypothetical protein